MSVILRAECRPVVPVHKHMLFAQNAVYPAAIRIRHQCGICEYHETVPRSSRLECEIVSGAIQNMGGCDQFSSNLIEAANDSLVQIRPSLLLPRRYT